MALDFCGLEFFFWVVKVVAENGKNALKGERRGAPSNLTWGQFRVTDSPVPPNAFKMSLDCESEPTQTQGGCAHSAQKSPWPPGDSSPEPSCCEETALTAALLRYPAQLSQSCKFCHSSPSSASNQAAISRIPHPQINLLTLLPVNRSYACFGKLQLLISLHCNH